MDMLPWRLRFYSKEMLGRFRGERQVPVAT